MLKAALIRWEPLVEVFDCRAIFAHDPNIGIPITRFEGIYAEYTYKRDHVAA